MSLRSVNKSSGKRTNKKKNRSPEKGKQTQKYSPSSSPPRNQFKRSPRAIPPPPATPKQSNVSQPTRAVAQDESKVTTPRRRKEFSGVDKKSRVVNATVILGSNGVGKQHSPTPQKQIKRKSPQRNSDSTIGNSVGTPTHRTRPLFQPSEKPNLPRATGNSSRAIAIFKDADESISRAKDVVASVRARRGIDGNAQVKQGREISINKNKFVLKPKSSLRRGRRKKKVIQ